MSWNDLVKNNLVGTGHVSKAAILGHDGSVWGKSDNLNLTEGEAQAAARGFNNPDGIQASGLFFEGDKYFVLQVDGERVMGKKASKGFFLFKTAQTVIVALYAEGVQPEQCSKAAGALADYFKGTGY